MRNILLNLGFLLLCSHAYATEDVRDNSLFAGRDAPSVRKVDALMVDCREPRCGEDPISVHAHVFYGDRCSGFDYRDVRIVDWCDKSLAFDQYSDNVLFVPAFVQNIDKGAFRKHHKITYAFRKKRNLRQIIFERNSQIKSIGAKAFAHTAIQEICIPDTVVELGNECFAWCRGLKSVRFGINSQLRIMGIGAFMHTGIADLHVPNSVEEIGYHCCYNCSCLENLYINVGEGSNLKRIGIEAFDSGLFYVQFMHDKVASDIKNTSLVKYCCFFEHIRVDSFVMDNNTKDQHPLYPKSRRYLADDAETLRVSTTRHDSRDTLIIPKSVKSICNDTKIYDRLEYAVKAISARYVIFERDPELSDIGSFVFCNNSNLESIIIPSTVKKIGKFCFSYCDRLKSVEFAPDSILESIGAYAFHDSGLESIIIPSTVKKIGEGCFENCDRLKSVEFADNSGLECIGAYAFYNTALESIRIPSNVRFIGECCFAKCERLVSVIFDESSQVCTIEHGAFGKNTKVYGLSQDRLKALGVPEICWAQQ